ncbi:hypothetical protein PR048_029310 [Dryococelus australis]|uniref:Uncharacterized protein n=1 Tax=Dryococelus australis TaxID=614101 RepID=A0ABQ9GCZ6_9NEOP|nr:hypothetical protein PR048_029310 [Dryococelus australis]
MDEKDRWQRRKCQASMNTTEIPRYVAATKVSGEHEHHRDTEICNLAYTLALLAAYLEGTLNLQIPRMDGKYGWQRRKYQASMNTTEIPRDDKIDVKHVYSEVDFAIGSQFIRHALDDSDSNSRLARKQVASAILPGRPTVSDALASQPRMRSEWEAIWAALNSEVLKAAPECEGGGNGRSPRKSTDQQHSSARFPQARQVELVSPEECQVGRARRCSESVRLGAWEDTSAVHTSLIQASAPANPLLNTILNTAAGAAASFIPKTMAHPP